MSFEFSSIKRHLFSEGFSKERLEKVIKNEPFVPIYWTFDDIFVSGIDGETGEFTFIDRRNDFVEVDCEVIKSERI